MDELLWVEPAGGERVVDRKSEALSLGQPKLPNGLNFLGECKCATRFKSYKSTIIIVICSRIIVVCISVVIAHHNYHNYNCGDCGISAPNGSNCVDNCDNCGNHNSLFAIMVTIIYNYNCEWVYTII